MGRRGNDRMVVRSGDAKGVTRIRISKKNRQLKLFGLPFCSRDVSGKGFSRNASCLFI